MDERIGSRAPTSTPLGRSLGLVHAGGDVARFHRGARSPLSFRRLGLRATPERRSGEGINSLVIARAFEPPRLHAAGAPRVQRRGERRGGRRSTLRAPGRGEVCATSRGSNWAQGENDVARASSAGEVCVTAGKGRGRGLRVEAAALDVRRIRRAARAVRSAVALAERLRTPARDRPGARGRRGCALIPVLVKDTAAARQRLARCASAVFGLAARTASRLRVHADLARRAGRGAARRPRGVRGDVGATAIALPREDLDLGPRAGHALNHVAK